jgi:hypothetical protein
MKKLTVIGSLIVIVTLWMSACSTSGIADSAQMTEDAAASSMPDGAAPGVEGQGMPPEGMPPEGMSPEGAPAGQPPQNSAPTAEAVDLEATAENAGPIHTADVPKSTYQEDTTTETAPLNIDAVFALGNRTYNKTHEDISASEDDQSAALVTNGGNLTVGYAAVTTSGDTSSRVNSSNYGQNAAILAKNASTLKVLYSSVATSGAGANGVFAIGEETTATLLDDSVDTTGDYAHAVMVNEKAGMKLTNVDMTTAGLSSAAIATGLAGGTITIEGGSAATSGSNSPGIFSAGEISITGAVISARASEAAVIKGGHSLTLSDSDLSSSATDNPCVMIYQNNSGASETATGDFSMSGGSLTCTGSGPLFYITNNTGNIMLSQVEVNVESGVLVNASAGEWGSSGSNGGTAILIADAQNLTGDIVADSSSTVSITLKNGSSLSGAISPDNSARVINLNLDASSSWTVTANSYLSNLSDTEGVSGSDITNIIGNGYTVYYNKNANTELRGKIYNLSGGGYLKPIN